MIPLILPLRGNEEIAARLSEKMDFPFSIPELRRFPDGETYVRIGDSLAERSVILVCTLDRPDEKLLPLLFLAETTRDLGASKVGLVAPYLAYMRQDRRFRPGEGVTSTYFGKLISGWFDWLITIDPHLHRRSSLDEIYTIPTHTLHAAPLISKWIKENIHKPILIGPDSESEQWVAAVAEDADAPHVVLEKVRRGDRDVQVSVPEISKWLEHTPVLVDDIISTARTMIETIMHLKRTRLSPPICIGVHGIFAGRAYEDLIAAGAQKIVSVNTIPHGSNMIDCSPLLLEVLRNLD